MPADRSESSRSPLDGRNRFLGASDGRGIAAVGIGAVVASDDRLTRAIEGMEMVREDGFAMLDKARSIL
jgi:hypothetical protein